MYYWFSLEAARIDRTYKYKIASISPQGVKIYGTDDGSRPYKMLDSTFPHEDFLLCETADRLGL